MSLFKVKTVSAVALGILATVGILSPQAQAIEEEADVIEVPFESVCKELGTSLPKPSASLRDGIAHDLLIRITGEKSIRVMDIDQACDGLKKLHSVARAPLTEYNVTIPEAASPGAVAVGKKPKNWQFRFYFGPSKTYYGKTDLTIKSSRLDIVARDVELTERNNFNFYDPTQKGHGPLQWIDEPTNTFIFSFQKNDKHVIELTVFHPKYLMLYKDDWGDSSMPMTNNNVHVTGTVDGVHVDHCTSLNQTFDGYNAQPGEINLSRFQNTFRHMQFELGYGRKINLTQGKWGKLSLIPTASASVFYGHNISAIGKLGEYWVGDEYEPKDGIMGVGASAQARLEWSTRNGRWSVFAASKYSYAKMKYAALDGIAEHNLQFTNLTFGVAATLFPGRRK